MEILIGLAFLGAIAFYFVKRRKAEKEVTKGGGKKGASRSNLK